MKTLKFKNKIFFIKKPQRAQRVEMMNCKCLIINLMNKNKT